MTWQPLSDHWDEYQSNLESALADGLMDDPLDAQIIIYPDELFLGEGEKEDIRSFVTERLNEVYQSFMQNEEHFDPNVFGTYLFRSILIGMVWERERIGK